MQLTEITAFMRPGYEYALKCHIPGCLHKTEIGGVRLGVKRENALVEAQALCDALVTQKL